MTDDKGTTTILKLLLLQLKIVTNNLQAKGHYYTQEVVFWYFYKSNFPSRLQKTYKPGGTINHTYSTCLGFLIKTRQFSYWETLM